MKNLNQDSCSTFPSFAIWLSVLPDERFATVVDVFVIQTEITLKPVGRKHLSSHSDCLCVFIMLHSLDQFS